MIRKMIQKRKDLKLSIVAAHKHMEQFALYSRENNHVSANYHALIARMIINRLWNDYFHGMEEL